MPHVPSDFSLTLPSKYSKAQASSAVAQEPPLEWMARTWSVVHSTLPMWRSARNVRISYTPLPPHTDGRTRLGDLVEYEPIDAKKGELKAVRGIDTRTAQAPGWDWRGSGWLFFVGSHWEVLGWGEATAADGHTERWVITWFMPTFFTKEGIDIYCDGRQGLSHETYNKIDAALRALDAHEVVTMVERDMRPVELKLPWIEK
ncbi:hypothetical protein CDD82_4 [Ophiocordyceps australis]|uniref:Uncharacterized protein n=1 Tax=Ophiocordyceps australis TaxID=1399860 RepID=A0A2C5ZP73_9HYPO|nr:hypothetical protein CDD82_4 [Ophiocordyceps australis]